MKKTIIIILVLVLSATFAPLGAMWFNHSVQELNDFNHTLMENSR